MYDLWVPHRGLIVLLVFVGLKCLFSLALHTYLRMYVHMHVYSMYVRTYILYVPISNYVRTYVYVPMYIRNSNMTGLFSLAVHVRT